MNTTNWCVWEVFVPTATNDGKPIDIQHHRAWDRMVREITNGLTIYHPAKGEWINPDGELFRERMIPVRVACTSEQMEQIAIMTAKHYLQQEVMYYLVSDKVFIRRF